MADIEAGPRRSLSHVISTVRAVDKCVAFTASAYLEANVDEMNVPAFEFEATPQRDTRQIARPGIRSPW